MKKILQIIISSLLLASGVVVIILLAQQWVDGIKIDFPFVSSDLKGTYLAVSIIMGVCAGASLVWLIISLFFGRGNALLKLNALGGLLIATTVTVLALITYANLDGKLQNMSIATLQAAEYFPVALSALIFLPSVIGYIIVFSKK